MANFQRVMRRPPKKGFRRSEQKEKKAEEEFRRPVKKKGRPRGRKTGGKTAFCHIHQNKKKNFLKERARRRKRAPPTRSKKDALAEGY